MSGRGVLGLVMGLSSSWRQGRGGCRNVRLFKIGWEEMSELSRDYYPILDVYVPNNEIPDKPTPFYSAQTYMLRSIWDSEA